MQDKIPSRHNLCLMWFLHKKVYTSQSFVFIHEYTNIVHLKVSSWDVTNDAHTFTSQIQIEGDTQRNFAPPADKCENSPPSSNPILHSEEETSMWSNNKQNGDFKDLSTSSKMTNHNI